MAQRLLPDDRVLVLQAGRCSALRLRDWALAVPQGLLVGLGEQSVIRNLRRELADCENSLFVSGSRDEIPWRDAFFTVIFDPDYVASSPGGATQATKDMRRVLHPAGRIYSIEP